LHLLRLRLVAWLPRNRREHHASRFLPASRNLQFDRTPSSLSSLLAGKMVDLTAARGPSSNFSLPDLDRSGQPKRQRAYFVVPLSSFRRPALSDRPKGRLSRQRDP